MRSVVDGWLASAGLSLNDFLLWRIDYDYNFYMEHEESDVLMNTMQQLSSRNMRMKKWGEENEENDENDEKEKKDPSVYYMSKSRHAQLYEKDKELEEKGKPVGPEERCLCRQEVQCHAGHIKYMRRRYGRPRDWDSWVTPQMEAEYLTKAAPIFPAGDFYTLDGASRIIQRSSISPTLKGRIQNMLAIIQNGTIDAAKKQFSPNTVRKYLAILKELNVSPLTISTNPEENPCGITYIQNPFFKSNGI